MNMLSLLRRELNYIDVAFSQVENIDPSLATVDAVNHTLAVASLGVLFLPDLNSRRPSPTINPNPSCITHYIVDQVFDVNLTESQIKRVVRATSNIFMLQNNVPLLNLRMWTGKSSDRQALAKYIGKHLTEAHKGERHELEAISLLYEFLPSDSKPITNNKPYDFFSLYDILRSQETEQLAMFHAINDNKFGAFTFAGLQEMLTILQRI